VWQGSNVLQGCRKAPILWKDHAGDFITGEFIKIEMTGASEGVSHPQEVNG
jgi:hypothetical protein